MSEEGLKSIKCEDIPPSLINKQDVKHYFQQFGQIARILIKPKKRCCIIDYVTHEGASNAMAMAGEYKGEMFSVGWDKKKERVKKEKDPDWTLDPDVQAELEAMGDYSVKKRYNLRPEGMVVDTEIPSGASKKERKLKRTWKAEQKAKMASTAASKITVSNAEQQELYNLLNQPALTTEDKFKMLEARDKLIRLTQNKKQIDILKTKRTIGTCPDMCPERERLMREVQHQVAIYEQESGDRTMNHALAVKQYSRSSADQESPLPHDLRNVDVLQMTMGYLMHRIINLCDNPDVNLSEWFHFLWDRTRGIRKDITQQELCSQGSVELVEQCARFHIHCSARLVAEDPSVFDQKINTENLTKCLQTLKYMYHDLEIKGERCPNEAEFRAYVILLNLNDGNFMWEVQQLRLEIQKSPEIKFALKVHSALDKNNYVQFFQLVKSTTYLNACILLRYFIQVRFRALRTIVKCYSPRAPYTQFPLFEFTRILAFEGNASSIDFLEYYGLTVNDEQTHVCLDKRMFSLPDLPYVLDRAVNVVESKRRKSIGEIVCGKQLPAPIFEQHVTQNSFDENGYINIENFMDVKKTVDVFKESNPPAVLKERSNSPLTITTTAEPSKHFWKAKTEYSNSTNIFANLTKEDSQPKLEEPPKQSFFASFKTSSTTRSSIFGGESNELPPLPPQTQDEPDAAPPSNAPKKGGFHFKLSTPSPQPSPQLQVEERPVEKQVEERVQKQVEERVQKQMEERRVEKQVKERNLEVRRAFELAHKQQAQKLLEEIERKKKQEMDKLIDLEYKRKMEEFKRRDLHQAKRKKAEEKLRKMKEQQALKLKEKQDEIIIRGLMESMLCKVEDDYRKLRLKELRILRLKRSVISRWKLKVTTNKRKRKAIDHSPLWVNTKTPKQTAEEFYTSAQDFTLYYMKRYKRGSPIDINIKVKTNLEKIDLVKLTGKLLLKSYMKKSVYWKVNVVLTPDLKGFNSIENMLKIRLESDSLVEQHMVDMHKVTYCIQKNNWDAINSETDGLIIIANAIDENLLGKLAQITEKAGSYINIPLVLILQQPNESEIDLQDTCFENFKIIDGHFSLGDLSKSFDDSMIYLADNYKVNSPLELNILKSFLQQNLGVELWRRIASFAKWNVAYKKCLMNPQIVINLFNEGLNMLEDIVLSNEIHEYADFPVIFRDLLPSKIPDYLPCDYKYFPSFWKQEKYKLSIKDALSKLVLPEFQEDWPPTDQIDLERAIFDYCSCIFDDPERPFYRVMATILRNFEHDNLQNILWTNIIEVIAQEKISAIDYNFTETFYTANTVFNQLFVIYNKELLSKFTTDVWFYVTNPIIQKEIDVELNKPKDTSFEEIEVDLDKTFEEVMNADCSESTLKRRSELEEFKFLMDDLEESMAIQKKINERLQSSLKLIMENS